MTQGEAAPDRTVWSLTGKDALTFLQGLVTNDLRPLDAGPGIVWTALLTPQGKYLADFFVLRRAGGELLIDITTVLAPATLRRLTMYRLRADVQIAATALHVQRGLGQTPPDAPSDALADPRHPALGWRAWRAEPGTPPVIDWDRIRVAHVIPESGTELLPDESYILEAGFERLHGVDFRKGCYVGQEVTARMKHKTELRKGLARVSVKGKASAGTEILADGKPAGQLFTRSGDQAIAYLRFDRADATLTAGAASLQLDPTSPGPT
ncbi:MAG: folate-binding protein [Rhodobacterales bacterium]|nr:folate-binding protein [Rhodobacterales bacterium]